jgi:hypothetical protein
MAQNSNAQIIKYKASKQLTLVSKYILMLLLLYFINSCENKENLKQKIIKNKTEHISIYKRKILSLDFPDTVKLNKVVEGNLTYDVNNIGFDPKLINSRFTVYISASNLNEEKYIPFDKLDKYAEWSIVDTLNNGKYRFYAVFEKKGRQTLNIGIMDFFYLKPSKHKSNKDKITLRKSESFMYKVVYVID